MRRIALLCFCLIGAMSFHAFTEEPKPAPSDRPKLPRRPPRPQPVISPSRASSHGAFAGLMVRESIDPNAKSATCGVTLLSSNLSSRVAARRPAGAVPPPQAPCWVKLIRKGSVIEKWWAPDVNGAPGVWQKAGPDATGFTADTVLLGMAVNSGNSSNAAVASFDHVNVTVP